MPQEQILDYINAQRRAQGFLTVEAMLRQFPQAQFLDPFSTLISDTVKIGAGNRFYPNVVLECRGKSEILIGDENVFYPGSMLLAEAGRIHIGNQNILGYGGLRISSTDWEAAVIVCNRTRLMHGPDISGPARLGDGSQVLGAISVMACSLGDGEDYQNGDPDLRGGVLKGHGRARYLRVHQGEVIYGQGSFAQDMIERQISYHPKPGQGDSFSL